MNENTPLISIIVPVYNGVKWIKRCFEGILHQTALNQLLLEICVCNDASTDNTLNVLNEWQKILEHVGIPLKIFNNISGASGGVGYSKNRCVAISKGQYLCFQDVDDVMLPDRILQQYRKAVECGNNVIVGCKFKRDPENSTLRYTKWANFLTQQQLNQQVFTSHGPTIIMPTWFCSRQVFDRVGGFFESKKGTPEDLVFFYKHLDFGGKIVRVDEVLLIYTYHPFQTTFSISKDTIWNLRVERLERVVLANWSQFTIWNAGKQGRKLYSCLSEENKEKVVALCDVDRNKIGQKYVPFDPIQRKARAEVDIIHFRDAVPPFVICIKLDLTEGVFEKNLRELNLKEGVDYVMFS